MLRTSDYSPRPARDAYQSLARMSRCERLYCTNLVRRASINNDVQRVTPALARGAAIYLHLLATTERVIDEQPGQNTHRELAEGARSRKA